MIFLCSEQNSEKTKALRGGGDTHTCVWLATSVPHCCVWQGPGEPRDVFLKVASGPSPEIKDFFVIIYT